MGGRRRCAHTTSRSPVDLSYSQVAKLADAMAEAVKVHGSREGAARALGLGNKTPIDCVMRQPRPGSLRLERAVLAQMAAGLKIDMSHWDLSDTR
jgi:hypothetical protein